MIADIKTFNMTLQQGYFTVELEPYISRMDSHIVISAGSHNSGNLIRFSVLWEEIDKVKDFLDKLSNEIKEFKPIIESK